MEYNKETWIENFNLLTETEDIKQNNKIEYFIDNLLSIEDFKDIFDNMDINSLNFTQKVIITQQYIDLSVEKEEEFLLELEEFSELYNINYMFEFINNNPKYMHYLSEFFK